MRALLLPTYDAAPSNIRFFARAPHAKHTDREAPRRDEAVCFLMPGGHKR